MTNIIDSTQDNMSNMGDAAKERYNMLVSRAQEGALSDSERTELDQLRERFGM